MRIAPFWAIMRHRAHDWLNTGQTMAGDFRIANDNIPAEKPSDGVFSRVAPQQPQQPLYLTKPTQLMEYTPVFNYAPKKEPSSALFGLSALLWVAGIACMAWSAYALPNNAVHMAIVIAGIWASLFYAICGARHNHSLAPELGSATAIAAFGLAIYVASWRFGLLTPPVIAATALAGAGLAMSWAFGSLLALRLAGAGAVAAVYLALNQGSPLWLSAVMATGLVALTWHSIARRDALALGLSLSAIIFGVAGLLYTAVTAGFLSPLGGTALFTALAASAYRGSRFFQDKAAPMINITAGFTAMSFWAGAVALTDSWANPDRFPWDLGTALASDPVSKLLAVSVLGGAVSACLFAELLRVKSRPQSAGLALVVTAAIGGLVTLPFFADKLGFLAIPVETGILIPGRMSAALLIFGVVFGALIMGFVNAVRRRYLLLIAGYGILLLALGASTLDLVLLQPENLALAASVAFITLLIGTLFIRRKARQRYV